MKQAQRILLALTLVLVCFVVYQQKIGLDNLETSITQLNFQLDLSVLDSCGIITNGNGHGSCVAIEPNLILTAGHCINISDTWIEINGKQYKIVDKWRSETHDVGFVVIDANLPYLKLGNTPEILKDVYLMGTPRDKIFINTITKGVICKLDLKYTDSVIDWTGNFVCDAMDWCGGSGGPVLDIRGNILGIYVGLFVDVDNFSVCEPVSHIKEALEEYNNRGQMVN